MLRLLVAADFMPREAAVGVRDFPPAARHANSSPAPNASDRYVLTTGESENIYLLHSMLRGAQE